MFPSEFYLSDLPSISHFNSILQSSLISLACALLFTCGGAVASSLRCPSQPQAHSNSSNVFRPSQFKWPWGSMGEWCWVTALALALAVPCWIAQSFTSISFLGSDMQNNSLSRAEHHQWQRFEPAMVANAFYMVFRPLSYAFSSHSKIMLLNKVWHLFLSNRVSKLG
jgi:hypothetical protein